MRHRLASVAMCAGLATAGPRRRKRTNLRPTRTGRAAALACRAAGHRGAARPVREVAHRVQDLGRWAPVGQESRGTTSFITPQKVLDANKLVKDGIVVSLAHAEPQVAAADVLAPGVFHRVTNAITETGTTDNYQVSYHGQTVAHVDTWCHFFENGQMYNGVPVKENITTESGCIKGSIMNWRGGITTRAVLYDIAQLKGVDLGRSQHADHARRPRSVGEEVRREDRAR